VRDTAETRTPHTPAETAARREMAMASLMGGMALANARLGAIHGIAGPLGAWLGAPHGALCAGLLVATYEENLQNTLLSTARPDLPERFDELGRLLCGDDNADARDATTFFRGLVSELEIKPLRYWGLAKADFPALVAMARQAGSMKGNPVLLSDSAIENIIERSW
jgi:alcohol dehydrogenase class IV